MSHTRKLNRIPLDSFALLAQTNSWSSITPKHAITIIPYFKAYLFQNFQGHQSKISQEHGVSNERRHTQHVCSHNQTLTVDKILQQALLLVLDGVSTTHTSWGNFIGYQYDSVMPFLGYKVLSWVVCLHGTWWKTTAYNQYQPMTTSIVHHRYVWGSGNSHESGWLITLLMDHISRTTNLSTYVILNRVMPVAKYTSVLRMIAAPSDWCY